jgi:hypothetical protein
MVGLHEERVVKSGEVQVWLKDPTVNDGAASTVKYAVVIDDVGMRVDAMEVVASVDCDKISDDAVILEVQKFGDDGRVTLTTGVELCPFSGMAKCIKNNDAFKADKNEGEDDVEPVQQNTELY